MQRYQGSNVLAEDRLQMDSFRRDSCLMKEKNRGKKNKQREHIIQTHKSTSQHCTYKQGHIQRSCASLTQLSKVLLMHEARGGFYMKNPDEARWVDSDIDVAIESRTNAVNTLKPAQARKHAGDFVKGHTFGPSLKLVRLPYFCNLM